MQMDPIVFESGDVRLCARPMTRLDRNAVFATWMQSAREHLKDTPAAKRFVEWDVFQSGYPDLVEDLLNRERTVVLFRREDPGVPHAWACASATRIHWAYVPFPVRGEGIGKAAISAALGRYPERIEITSPFPKLTARFVFNPFALRFP